MKLTKTMIKTLRHCVWGFEQTGRYITPIHVGRAGITKDSGFSKSYTNYVMQMRRLIDAGIIERRDATYAYIKDVDTVRKLLKDNE